MTQSIGSWILLITFALIKLLKRVSFNLGGIVMGTFLAGWITVFEFWCKLYDKSYGVLLQTSQLLWIHLHILWSNCQSQVLIWWTLMTLKYWHVWSPSKDFAYFVLTMKNSQAMFFFGRHKSYYTYQLKQCYVLCKLYVLFLFLVMLFFIECCNGNCVTLCSSI